MSAIRDAPAGLPGGLSLHADGLPVGPGLRELQAELGQIEIGVRDAPGELHLTGFGLLQQQLQIRSSPVHDHHQSRLDDIGIRMQLIRSIQRADREPVFAIRWGLEVEAAGFGSDGLHMLPIEAIVPRQKQPNLFGSQPTHFGLIEPIRNAKARLIGADRVGLLCRGRGRTDQRRTRQRDETESDAKKRLHTDVSLGRAQASDQRLQTPRDGASARCTEPFRPYRPQSA